MKKQLLTAIFGIAVLGMSAQIEVKDNSANNVANSSTIHLTTTAYSETTAHFPFKNTGGHSASFMVKRFDLVLNKINAAAGDSASAYFCTGVNCYVPSTTITPNSVLLAAGESSELITYLDEASAAGYSNVQYQIYEDINPSNQITFTIEYGDKEMSIKENSGVFSIVSEVFPNPVNANSAQIVVNVVSMVNGALTITNALGAIISTEVLSLNAGKNTLLINSESLNSGIYFATITSPSRSSKIVKKFIVTK